jgi:hypothetical protein
MRRVVSAVLALACWLTGAPAQDAEEGAGPDLDFLEYLGTWAEDDDEWLAIEEWEKGNSAKPEEDSEESDKDEDEDDDDESE